MYSAVYSSTAQYSTYTEVQHNRTQCSAVQAMQYSAVQYNIEHCSKVQDKTALVFSHS